ncbi:MAG: hypothetical protein ACRERR_08570 [Moraxellaceae bacterium]
MNQHSAETLRGSALRGLALSSNDFLEDDGIGVSASARYYIDPRFSAAVGYSATTEIDGFFLSARYNFK